MTGWFTSLFAAPTCPGCGRELVEWTETVARQGYAEQRNWSGCPEYVRIKSTTGWFAWDERDKHYAKWRPGRQTPLHTTYAALDYGPGEGEMSRKARRGDVVELEWLDSEHIALGWEPTAEYVKAATAPQSYRTAGYFLAATGDRTLVALSIDPANRHVTHAMSIPTVAITKAQVLGRANRRVRKALKP